MKNNLNALESLHRGKLLKLITIRLHEPPIKDSGTENLEALRTIAPLAVKSLFHVKGP